MTPGPSLQDVISTVHADAASDDPLEQLSVAARTAVELEEVAADAESLAAKVLGEMAITHAAIEERLLQVTPRGAATGTPVFTPRASTAIEKALAEALKLGHNYIGTEHILLALFADAEGFAAK